MVQPSPIKHIPNGSAPVVGTGSAINLFFDLLRDCIALVPLEAEPLEQLDIADLDAIVANPASNKAPEGT